MPDQNESFKISVRPATAGDDEFLFRVYADTREEEFAVLGWDRAQLDAFLKMQFMMRRQSYAMQTPGAEAFVAEVDGQAAATFITDRRAGMIDLVDIAVSRGMRRRGIASRLLERLKDEGLPIELNVEVLNDTAIRLYEKFGFEEIESGDVYKTMRWTPCER
jgi:ribosomal protein S18 acetylase RimI-like enzyme